MHRLYSLSWYNPNVAYRTKTHEMCVYLHSFSILSQKRGKNYRMWYLLVLVAFIKVREQIRGLYKYIFYMYAAVIEILCLGNRCKLSVRYIIPRLINEQRLSIILIKTLDPSASIFVGI